MDQPARNSRSRSAARWAARILSILSVGVLLVFVVGEADLSHPISLTGLEILGLLFFPGGIVVGMILAWRREGIGAGVTIASLLAFYLLNVLSGEGLPSGPFFVLFALPGFIFGLSWLLGRARAIPTTAAE